MSAASVISVCQTRLATQEAVIQRSLKSFIELGDALTVVRDERLYRENYPTFEAYCQGRWGFTPQHAGRLMIAASIALEMEPMGSIPNERQARELAKVPEPKREQVWRETLDRTDGKPTAAAVREVASPAKPEPQLVKPEPEPAPNAAEPLPRPAPRLVPRPTALTDDDRRREVIETAQRIAPHLVSNFQADVVSIIAGIELGETNLITAQTIDDLREAIDVLEAKASL